MICPTLSTQEGIQNVTVNDEGISYQAVRIDTCRIEFKNSVLQVIESLSSLPDTFFVVDMEVFRLYEDFFKGIQDRLIQIQGGDENKNMNVLFSLLDGLYDQGVHRKAKIYAIGGGVTTDLVGLASNLHFRGVSFGFVPTTLLGMVDAAIGGKTGVNNPRQKNLHGSFYHPEHIIICQEFLGTLPEEQIRSALGEVLKVGIVGEPRLIELLEAYDGDVTGEIMRDMIALAIQRKLELLGENSFERDLARILNFGHSIGHPIEDITHFRVPHGLSVCCGIAIATHISYRMGKISQTDFDRIFSVMQTQNLPSFYKDISGTALWGYIRRLVVQRGGIKLLFVIPTGIGSAEVIDDITEGQFC